MEPGVQGTEESTESRSRRDPDSPHMEDIAMVPSPVSKVSRLSTPATQAWTSTMSVPIMPQLAVWSISGKDSAVKAFEAKLQSSSLNHGGPKSSHALKSLSESADTLCLSTTSLHDNPTSMSHNPLWLHLVLPKSLNIFTS